MKIDRSVWTINNKHFTLILDAKTESGKVVTENSVQEKTSGLMKYLSLNLKMKIPKRNMIISYQIC